MRVIRFILSPFKWVLSFVVGKIITIILILAILISLSLFWWVQKSGELMVASIENITPTDVAIVFGAGLNNDGTPTNYLAWRLDAAKTLYEQGKVKAILVSGDNSNHSYNEPQSMTDYLVSRGVPGSVVVQDFAGLHTNDTCQRAAEIFGVKNAVVISQYYHVPRTAFSCANAGINIQGVGVNEEHPSWITLAGYKVREYFSSDQAAIDVIFNAKAEILGNYEDTIDKILRATK